MTEHVDLERDVRRLLAETAPRREPVGLFDAVMAGSEGVRQRPAILPRLRRPGPGARHAGIGRVLLAIAVTAVGLTLVGTALLGGGIRPAEVSPHPAVSAPAVAPSRFASPTTQPVGQTVIDPMIEHRTGHVAVGLQDGRMLVIGGVMPDPDGRSVTSAEILDPGRVIGRRPSP